MAPHPAAGTCALEREIDQQVYALYGLTPEQEMKLYVRHQRGDRRVERGGPKCAGR